MAADTMDDLIVEGKPINVFRKTRLKDIEENILYVDEYAILYRKTEGRLESKYLSPNWGFCCDYPLNDKFKDILVWELNSIRDKYEHLVHI